MRTIRSIALFVALGVLFAGLNSSSVAAPGGGKSSTPETAHDRLDLAGDAARWVPGEAVVRFRPGLSRSEGAAAVAAKGARIAERLAGGRAFARVKLPPGLSVARGVKQLRGDPRIVEAEPNLLRFVSHVPNDPLFNDQWGLHNTGQPHRTSQGGSQTISGTPDADIDAPEAWDLEQGDPDTVIAIIDTGVDVTHPDLAPNIWVNPDDPPGDADGDDDLDDDHNGYPDDVNGWDFAENDDTLLHPDQSVFGAEHGTHVAGTAAAAMDDNTGVAGVCPQCSIMVLKIGRPATGDLNGDGIDERFMELTLDAELEAIEYAISMGADVVNASFGAPFFWSRMEWKAYRDLGNAGVLSVVASGNGRGDNDLFMPLDFDGDQFPDTLSPIYPASYNLPGIVSVAASTDRDEYGIISNCANREPEEWLCFFTNWGHESVDVAAPGTDVISTLPNNNYAVFDGTSMAAPHVAGLAGLVKSRFERQEFGADPANVKTAILRSVERPPGSFDTVRAFPPALFPQAPATGDFTRTNGRVNAARALNEPLAVAPERPSDGNIDGAKRIRKRATGRVSWPEDVNDVYRKRLRKGRRYRVVLRPDGARDLDLWVWKQKTKEIWQIQLGCIDPVFRGCKLLDASANDVSQQVRERVTFRPKKTGRHYIQVVAWLFNEGNYTLRVRRCTRPAPRC
ncbi:MAG: S8 family serine peptidase [Actinomycetota bacterium]